MIPHGRRRCLATGWTWALLVTAGGVAEPWPPLERAAAQKLSFPDQEPEEIVERGNRLYERGDYLGSISAYETVLELGWENGHLHYNLGNAYFKADSLGRAILSWERAARTMPADPDVRANLELARTLARDRIEPLPAFWLVSAVEWWVRLIPAAWLVAVVGAGWLAVAGGVGIRLAARRNGVVVRWSVRAGALALVLFGPSFLARELELGRSRQGVILQEVTPVRSAPRADDDLTLFDIHEGATVRLDTHTGTWVEIVLADGKVGWVPVGVLEEI